MTNVNTYLDSTHEGAVPFDESFASQRVNSALKAGLAHRTARDGVFPAYSDEFLINTVALRGITLMRLGLSSLGRRFTESEMMCILSARPCGSWGTETGHLLAWEFAETYGLEDASSDDESSFGVQQATLAKLRTLTPLEAMALTDFCERWWQSAGALSKATEGITQFAEQCEWLGLVLSD